MSRSMERLKKIKTLTMRGTRYLFKVCKLRDARGLTDHPRTPGRTVMIDKDEEGKDLLATLIDELLHCCCWDIGNQSVDEISDGLADFLWDRVKVRFADDLTVSELEALLVAKRAESLQLKRKISK